MSQRSGWCVVLPVKRLEGAKTRLAGTYAPQRRDLALAFALDTTAAALTASGVVAVIAVTDDSAAGAALTALGALVVGDEPDAGLNPALRHGGAVATGLHPGSGVAALSADLPALRPEELAIALDRALGHSGAFVRDAAGSGTTLVTAAPGRHLQPGFGACSALAHERAGLVEIAADDLPGLRRDVDTADDLQDALTLGVGPHTRRLLG